MAGRDAAGRPSRLTGATADAIYANLRIGMTRKHAAETSGVAARTMLLWLHHGREADVCEIDECTADHHGPSSGELEYLQFLHAVEKAEADAVKLAVSSVAKGMGKDWRAGMAWLERRYPADWKPKDKVELNRSPGTAVPFEIRFILNERPAEEMVAIKDQGRPPHSRDA